IVVACTAIFSPLLVLGKDVRALGTARLSAKQHALGLIPAGAPVSASERLGSRLSERRFIYRFPYVRRARWSAVDVDDPANTRIPGFQRALRRYESQRSWRRVYASHDILVLRQRTK